MPEPESITTLESEKQDGIPRWIKTSGAIIGIAATAAGILLGVYNVSLEFKKETTKQREEETKAEKERTAQHKLDGETKQREQDVKLAELKKQFEIEEQKNQQQQAAKAAVQLELDRQVRQERREDQNRERDQRVQERKNLLEAISKLAGPADTALGTILTISKYADADSKQDRPVIIRTLALYAEQTCSGGELSAVFSTLRQIGPEALPEILNLNRIGKRNFEQAFIEYFTILLREMPRGTPNRITESRSPTPADPNAMPSSICKTINSASRASDAMDSKTQTALLIRFWLNTDPADTVASEKADFIQVKKNLRCAGEVLRNSAKLLSENLPTILSNKMDLSETYFETDSESLSMLSSIYPRVSGSTIIAAEGRWLRREDLGFYLDKFDGFCERR